jgi:uncharacterized integral membrane protein (TIGR00697 family)
MVLGNTGRMLLASFTAYLIGSLLNAYVMERMKKSLEKHLMARCVFSTLLGESIDAIIFITIAFVGTMPAASLAIMIVSQAIFKTGFEIVFYPITRKVINTIKGFAD